jgi:hypothetical protein
MVSLMLEMSQNNNSPATTVTGELAREFNGLKI